MGRLVAGAMLRRAEIRGRGPHWGVMRGEQPEHCHGRKVGGDMFRRLIFVATLVIALSAFEGPTASANSSNESFGFLAGSGFLCGLGPTACPDVARADNGDTIQITGSGMLTTSPKTARGSGTFVHKRGSITVASGTWKATDLLSFQDAGSSPVFPPALHAGSALFAVHLVVTGGPATGLQADGVLRVTCELPGALVSGNRDEGVRLVVDDIINFNKEVSGFTVFVKK